MVMRGAVRKTLLWIALVLALVVATTFAWLELFAGAGATAAIHDAVARTVPGPAPSNVFIAMHQASMVLLALLCVAGMARLGRTGSAPGLAGAWGMLVWLILLGLVALTLALGLIPAVTEAPDWWLRTPAAPFDTFDVIADLSGATATGRDVLAPVLLALWLVSAAVMTARGPAGRRVAWGVAVLALASLPLDLAGADGVWGNNLGPETLRLLDTVRTVDYLPAVGVLLAWAAYALSDGVRASVLYIFVGALLGAATLVNYEDAGRVGLQNLRLAMLHLFWGTLIVFGLLACAAHRNLRVSPPVFAAHAVALAVVMLAVAQRWSTPHGSGPAGIAPETATLRQEAVLLSSGLALVVVLAMAGAAALSARPRRAAKRDGAEMSAAGSGTKTAS